MDQQRKLKVAAIMDEFTYSCYAPECDLMQVTPDDFKTEIDGFEPDMLFIESVWRGKDNLWRFKLHDNTEALKNLTDYCRSKKIPVVFWSKEDPVHFGVFIRAASFADFVFTTDADCIELYKAHLGHERVYFLPFAAQPRLHNPIEEYERKDKFCFAGSFYVKYQERSQTFMDLASFFMEYGLDIYDRNFKKGETDNNSQTTSVASPVVENYYFPQKLQECILGGLPYSKITRAYKGYKYGVNMTSMVQSGFMFARRVFELLACNTVTVSNYSRGLEMFFGDLLIATNDVKRMKSQLGMFCGTELSYRKYRLAGLRHVLMSHLYEDRLDQIVCKVFGKSLRRPLPEILVVCAEKNACICEMFEKQTYERKRLVAVTPGKKIQDFTFDFVTVFSSQDYYGKNYLLDMALATRFASDKVVGKAAYYSEGALLYREKAYTHVKEPVQLRRQMAERHFLDESITMDELLCLHQQAEILALDEFNYCENASECPEVEDVELDKGISLDEIYAYTDTIPPVSLHKSVPFSTEELWKEVRIEKDDLVEKSWEDGMFRLERTVNDDKIVWLRTDKNYSLSDYTLGSRIGFFTEVLEKQGNVRCQIEYYDENNKKLSFLNFALDGFTLLRISDRARTFKLIFRMRGKSGVILKSMYASSPDSLLPAPFPMKNSLLITENYPDYEAPDSFASLHELAKEQGLEVLKVGEMPSYLPYSEYDGVQITAVQYEAIREYLSGRTFSCIYVCLPSEKADRYLSDYKGRIIDVK